MMKSPHASKKQWFGATVAAALGFALATSGAHAALVHHWTFDEANGQAAPEVSDSVGTSHGTFVNMDDTNRSLAANRALSFDGVDESISVAPAAGVFLSTQDYSVALWYKGTQAGVGGDQGFNLIGENTSNVWSTLGIRDGKASFVRYDGGWKYISSPTAINDDSWHLVVFVNAGGTQTGSMYVDGVVGDTGVSSAYDPCCGTVNKNFRVITMMSGALNAGFPLVVQYTSGVLDDVRLYNHALAQGEVDTLFAAVPPNPVFVPEPASLALLGLGALMVLRRRAGR